MIWPTIVQQFRVNPSEADREAPYIERNIEATRAAYDLEDIEVEPFSSQLSATGKLGELEQQTVLGAAGRPAGGQADLRAGPAGPGLLLRGRRPRRRPLRARRRGPRRWCSASASSTSPASAEGDQNWNNLHTVYTHGNGHDRGLRQPAGRGRLPGDQRPAVGRGPAGRTRTRCRGSAPTATSRGSTSARRARATPWSARPPRTPPTSSSTSATRRAPTRAQTTTYDGAGRGAGRQPVLRADVRDAVRRAQLPALRPGPREQPGALPPDPAGPGRSGWRRG